MFNGIPMAPPVAAPQAGINVPAMDQIGMAFQMLPLLSKLLMGNDNKNNQAATPMVANTTGAATTTPAGAGAGAAGTPAAPGSAATGPFTPVSYAGTGYQGKGALPPIGTPLASPTAALAPQMAQGMTPQTLMQRLGLGNPYAQNQNPYASAPGGFNSGLLNPTNLY